MDLIGTQITLLWYTTDADGDPQDTDETPTVTVTVNGSEVSSSTANEATGTYRTTFTPTARGRHVAEFGAEIDGVPEVGVQWRTVHDGLAEAQGVSFPEGIASWESAVS